MLEPTSHKKYEDLPPKQRRFIDSWITNGDRVEAYVEAGYSNNTKHRAKNARALFFQLHSIIKLEIDKKLASGVPKAIKKIDHLMDNAKSEGIQLKCAQEILDRTLLRHLCKSFLPGLHTSLKSVYSIRKHYKIYFARGMV